ncbi:MAG: hypothetical protein FWF72_00460 [Paludibacter sp.]|nr:hypothetical protein [Paludibacter sp.]
MTHKQVILAGIFALTMSGAALKISAQVGINIDTPKTTLDVVQEDQTTHGKGFRLDDGNQADGKVLTSDTDGIGTWQLFGLKMIEENPYDINYQTDSISFVKNVYCATGQSITLTAGKWKVDLVAVLSVSLSKSWAIPIPPGEWAWIYFQLTDNPNTATLVRTSDVAEGKQLVSMLYTVIKPLSSVYNIYQFATTQGFWTVNNTISTDKTYWVFAQLQTVSTNLPNSYLYRILCIQWENKLVAIPIL